MVIGSLLIVAVLLVRIAWALREARIGMEHIADELRDVTLLMHEHPDD